MGEHRRRARAGPILGVATVAYVREPTDGEARRRVEAATETIHGAILRLMEDGTHPRATVLAVARTSGALAAGVAEAEGEDVEEIPHVSADIMRRAGRQRRELPRVPPDVGEQ